MRDFIFLHHHDGPEGAGHDWTGYVSMLKTTGRFQGGSGIGDGECVRKSGKTPPISEQITGYIRVQAHISRTRKRCFPAILSTNPAERSKSASFRETDLHNAIVP